MGALWPSNVLSLSILYYHNSSRTTALVKQSTLYITGGMKNEMTNRCSEDPFQVRAAMWAGLTLHIEQGPFPVLRSVPRVFQANQVGATLLDRYAHVNHPSDMVQHKQIWQFSGQEHAKSKIGPPKFKLQNPAFVYILLAMRLLEGSVAHQLCRTASNCL